MAKGRGGKSKRSKRTGEELVRGRSLGVLRGGRWLVRDVDLALHRGKIVTLIGPNGSGKSTTAKMILGLLVPDEGRIKRAPDLRIGYVPQKLEINQALPLAVSRLMNLTAPHSPYAIKRALQRVGAAHCLDKQVQNLSGGELQRVLLARAIIAKPDLLVLDEPVQGVDFAGEIALYELIGELRTELDCAILLISHDLHIVMAASDEVICLNGHVCCSGTPARVSNDPQYQQLFGKQAARTLAVYHHQHNHHHCTDGSIAGTGEDCGCSSGTKQEDGERGGNDA